MPINAQKSAPKSVLNALGGDPDDSYASDEDDDIMAMAEEEEEGEMVRSVHSPSSPKPLGDKAKTRMSKPTPNSLHDPTANVSVSMIQRRFPNRGFLECSNRRSRSVQVGQGYPSSVLDLWGVFFEKRGLALLLDSSMRIYVDE